MTRKEKKLMENGTHVTENIVLCEDGKYRWLYSLNLLTDPTIFLLVWKIFFFIFVGIFSFVIVIDTVNTSGRIAERLLNNLKFCGYFIVGMTAVVLLGYLLYAAIMGGKYCVLFEMDEAGVNHKQIEEQAKKAKKLSKLTMAAGAASGRLTTIGAGAAAARTELYSDFSRVRKVKCYPKRHLIKVNTRFYHNQVYAKAQDFSFVQDFILSHCPQINENNTR